MKYNYKVRTLYDTALSPPLHPSIFYWHLLRCWAHRVALLLLHYGRRSLLPLLGCHPLPRQGRVGFLGRLQWENLTMNVIRKILCEMRLWLKRLHCKKHDWKVCYLFYPHLLECERHALLHIHPEVRLLSEDLTGDQGSGRNHLVLLETRGVILWNNYYSSNLQLSTYSL